MFIGYVPSRELTYPTCEKESHRLKSAKRGGYVSYPPVLFPLYFQNVHCFPRNSTTLLHCLDHHLPRWPVEICFGFRATSDAVLSVPEPKTWSKSSKSGASNGKEKLMRDTPLSSLTWLVFAPQGCPQSPWLQEWRIFLDPPPNGGGFFWCHVSFFFGGVTSRKRVHILTMNGIQYLQKGFGKEHIPYLAWRGCRLTPNHEKLWAPRHIVKSILMQHHTNIWSFCTTTQLNYPHRWSPSCGTESRGTFLGSQTEFLPCSFYQKAPQWLDGKKKMRDFPA